MPRRSATPPRSGLRRRSIEHHTLVEHRDPDAIGHSDRPVENRGDDIGDFLIAVEHIFRRIDNELVDDVPDAVDASNCMLDRVALREAACRRASARARMRQLGVVYSSR
jgi:hypothetical protein